MKKRSKMPQAPAKWERWLAALTSLTLVFTPPTALVIGLIEFATARKRHALFALHGLNIALWQVLWLLLFFDLFFTTSLLPAAGVWHKLFDATFIVNHQLWVNATAGEQTVIVLFYLLFTWNVVIIIWSIIAVLLGRTFSAPILGRLLSKE